MFKKKRAITQDELRRITEREGNPERRDYYEVLWFTGGRQSDIAQLDAAQIIVMRRLKPSAKLGIVTEIFGLGRGAAMAAVALILLFPLRFSRSFSLMFASVQTTL